MERGFPYARALFAAAMASALVLAVFALIGDPLPAVWAAPVALALLVALGTGVFVQGSGLFARPIRAIVPARAGGRLALTFDDGPDAKHTRRVLDVLERHGQRATFFVIGARAAAAPELLDEIVRRGHALANHSWTHAHTTPFWAVEKLAADLERAQTLLAQAAGKKPRWFRAPVGILSPRVVLAAKRVGLTLVSWSASARDGVARTTVGQAASRLERALRPGAILVLHDAAERGGREPICVQVLERVLEAMARRGLRSVTLDELIGGAA